MPIWASSEEDSNWIFDINFRGVLHGIRTFVPTMIEQDEPGHVVNTASVAGLIAGNGIYGVSKHAVVALTEALYQNLQAEGAKVGASVLCPPFVTTRIFESARNRPGGDEVESLLNDAILQDAMTPEQIADFVLDGIRDEQFYLIPHSRFDENIEGRVSNVVARRNWQPQVVQQGAGRSE